MPPDLDVLRPVRVIRGLAQSPAPAFKAIHVDHEMLEGLFDPFLLVDHFEMNGVFFAPHPHAGFSVSTYLFEDSEGAFLNRDSLGDDLVVRPGGILWAHAGAGLQHEENPAAEGSRVHGLQTWVNVPASRKHAPPTREAFEAGRLPSMAAPGGAHVRVLAGEWDGVRAPGELPAPIRYLDVDVPAGAEMSFALEAGHNAFVLVLRGDGWTGPAERESPLGADHVSAFGRAGGRVRIRAGEGGMRVAFGSGRPLEIPIVQHGPFVGASQEDLRRYFESYRSGRMGSLAER